MKFILWLFRGRPKITIDHMMCGLCGRGYMCDPFEVPDYKVNYDTDIGMCPIGEGCQIDA
jgi:hypothetical protein